MSTVVLKVKEQQDYDIKVDGYYYAVRRARSLNNDWKWVWSVTGGSPTRPRYCDPSGRTYKKVVTAIEQALVAEVIQAQQAREQARAKIEEYVS